jgi:hypothetical protein
LPTLAETKAHASTRNTAPPNDSVAECHCHAYQPIDAINAIAANRALIAQPQLSPAAAAGRRLTTRVVGIRSISIDHEPGCACTKNELTNSAAIGSHPPPVSQVNIGQIATSNGAEGIALATTKSCESPLSISNGISTFVAITALPVATPIEGIVLPLLSTVV